MIHQLTVGTVPALSRVVNTNSSQQEGHGFDPQLRQAFLCGVSLLCVFGRVPLVLPTIREHTQVIIAKKNPKLKLQLVARSQVVLACVAGFSYLFVLAVK